ncbi:lipoxygenase domain-containing protein 1-like protein [Aphelenchoides avenae]|nr:lipoxygenase domain-containing protein 1-like protein [Aphelenchus avenae]
MAADQTVSTARALSPIARTPRSKSPIPRTAASVNTSVTFAPDVCTYSVALRTGIEEGAETNANVFVQLTDAEGQQTDKIRLKCSITHRKKFMRGHTDVFLLDSQAVLGRLQYLDVWHERKPTDVKGDPWQLHSVNVMEHRRHVLYRFPCGKWLGKDLDEKVAHVRLEVNGEPMQVLRADDFIIE